MKIAIVANSTWNIYNFRQSLIRQLKGSGYQIIVIAPVDEYIHYLNETWFTRHIPLRHLSPQGRNPWRDLLLLRELYRIYRRERPDLILHYTIKPNIYGSLAARLAGIPSMSTITGLGYTFLHQGWGNRLVGPLYRFALRKVRYILFHNADDRQTFRDLRLAPPDRMLVVPGSGVNTNHFRPLPNPDSGKFIFLFIGRLLEDKGIREFVAAARQVRQICREAECWIVGEMAPQNPAAVPREEVLAWIEEKHIRYFGAARDVRKYLKQAHVLVLPSFREGMPRAVLEAMAMGRPVITTDVAGCRDTVAEGINGYLVPARDAMALAEAMVKMYQLSPGDLEAMGRASRARVLAEYDEKIINERYLALIRQVLKPGRVLSKRSLS